MKDNCPVCRRPPCVFYKDTSGKVCYKLCRKCGVVWKTFNHDIPAIECLLDEAEMLYTLNTAAFEAYTDTAIKLNMVDCVIKCGQCESPAFEVGLGIYKCFNKDCNFKWEE